MSSTKDPNYTKAKNFSICSDFLWLKDFILKSVCNPISFLLSLVSIFKFSIIEIYMKLFKCIAYI